MSVEQDGLASGSLEGSRTRERSGRELGTVTERESFGIQLCRQKSTRHKGIRPTTKLGWPSLNSRWPFVFLLHYYSSRHYALEYAKA